MRSSPEPTTYLESGKNNTKDGEQETCISEAHFAGSGHSSTDDERQEREVCHEAVSSTVVDAVDEDGEDGAQHTHGLVERNRNHGERQVGYSNVSSEKSAESDEGEVLATTQSRKLKIAQLHHGVGTHAGERGVQECQKPWEIKL